MKLRLILLMAALPLLGGGCVRHYIITMDNGSQIYTNGKPKLEGSRYIYKDPLGREGTVSSGRVREIAPASMVK
jgi:hypothetical protein